MINCKLFPNPEKRWEKEKGRNWDIFSSNWPVKFMLRWDTMMLASPGEYKLDWQWGQKTNLAAEDTSYPLEYAKNMKLQREEWFLITL